VKDAAAIPLVLGVVKAFNAAAKLMIILFPHMAFISP